MAAEWDDNSEEELWREWWEAGEELFRQLSHRERIIDKLHQAEAKRKAKRLFRKRREQ